MYMSFYLSNYNLVSSVCNEHAVVNIHWAGFFVNVHAWRICGVVCIDLDSVLIELEPKPQVSYMCDMSPHKAIMWVNVGRGIVKRVVSLVLLKCDMIKWNESDVGNNVFEILAKTVFKFFCFILFLALTNVS